jgi:hypothetical protein
MIQFKKAQMAFSIAARGFIRPRDMVENVFQLWL